jgi:hypothetical protein
MTRRQCYACPIQLLNLRYQMVWHFLLFFLSGSALAAEKSPLLVDTPLLIVDQSGKASATITLRNDSGAPIQQLRLNLSDFIHKGPAGKSYPLGTTSTLTTVNDNEKEILNGTRELAKDATLTIRVTVANLWEAGQSEAVLRNGQTDIPVLGGPKSSLKAIRIPAAYNVQIVSPTPDAPEIHFVGDRALIGLKNSDPFSYCFRWKLRLNGRLYDGGQKIIDLAPGGNKYFYLERPALNADFPEAGLITSGTVKDEIVKGNLVLEPAFEGDAITQMLPPKDLPVTFRLSYWTDNFQELLNGVCIFLLLALGGLFSIWVNSGIPNTSRALTVRRRVRDLEARIRGLGTSIDSRWRVLLESHLPAIRRELFSTPWVFPSFATTLDRLTKKVDMVEKWVEIAYGASIVLHQADPVMQLIPPTVLRWIHEQCSRALTPIESGLTTDDEVQTMKADLNAARNYLALTVAHAANPDLAKEIGDREARCQPYLAGLGNAHPQFAGLVNQVTAVVSTPLSPVNYVDRDSRSLKMDLVRAFVERVKELAGAPAGSPEAAALTRLQTCGSTLLMTYLVPNTHESLQIARLIVNQMCQDIYPVDALTSQMTMTPPAVTITTDPAVVEAESPVRLALRFNRGILNEAVARHEWTCTWDFGDQTSNESGWEVFHSYESGGIRQVEITICDLNANPVIPKSITGNVTVRDDRERSRTGRVWRFLRPEPETRLELARLTIMLALALLGLVAMGRQQAQNLSFLGAVGALIALGFGADTIKNLISQRSSNA